MLSPPDFGTNIIKHDLHVCCPYCTVSVLAPFLELGSHKSGFMKVVAEESRDGGKFIREYAKPWLPGVLPIQTRFVNSTSNRYSLCGYGLWMFIRAEGIKLFLEFHHFACFIQCTYVCRFRKSLYGITSFTQKCENPLQKVSDLL